MKSFLLCAALSALSVAHGENESSLRGKDEDNLNKNRNGVPHAGFSNLQPSSRLPQRRWEVSDKKVPQMEQADSIRLHETLQYDRRSSKSIHRTLLQSSFAHERKVARHLYSLNTTNTQSKGTPLCPGQQWIVSCKEGSEALCQQELEHSNVEIVHYLHDTDFFAVCIDSEEDLAVVEELLDVESVEEDPPRTLSYLPAADRSRHLAAQTIPDGVSQVGAEEFWRRYNKRGEGATVCVIDTGVNRDHEDFRKAIEEERFDGSESSDLVQPWYVDRNSHGTHCSGTVMADDSGVGVVGIAPKARLFTARVFDDSGSFTASSLVAAMSECAKGGADIISMSLGGYAPSFPERFEVNRLTEQGILIVAASGNEGNAENRVEYPASYENTISVGAVDGRGEFASFSTFNEMVDIAAPGVDVLSASTSGDDSYASKTGTSMAAPHVAGVAALLKSQFPEANGRQLREAMQKGAQDAGVCGQDKLYGNGVLDVMAAAQFLDTGKTESPAPTECIKTKVSVTTDDWGAETKYEIRLKTNGALVYRGGPYPNNQRATYTDEVSLARGCYEFAILDQYGDGTCCNDEYGRGAYSVEWSGESQVSFDDFQGATAIHDFGACGSEDTEDASSDENIEEESNDQDNDIATTDAVCGNGVVEAGEECDDGNRNNRDSCTNACNNARCGDGIIQTGVEECDDGNNSNTDSCTNSCERAKCGDGFVQDGEECDDGNNNGDDSCSTSCRLASCGDSVKQNGEECDDGNDVNNDSCSNSCKNARCGDGIVQQGEECDDGNNANGDGCSQLCESEAPVSTSGCSDGTIPVDLSYTTDRYADAENELYLYDVDADDDEFIWIATRRGIRSNFRYDASECIDASKCLKFFFFDTYGDGLSDGKLELKWNGQPVLDIAPNEIGETWKEGSPIVYWLKYLGQCEEEESKN